MFHNIYINFELLTLMTFFFFFGFKEDISKFIHYLLKILSLKFRKKEKGTINTCPLNPINVNYQN